MKEKSLKQINMNIVMEEELIDRYTNKRDQIKEKEIDFSHACICGFIGSGLGMTIVNEPSFDLLMFASMGGYAVGLMIPYVIKKIKIGELNYQIYISKGILKDLEEEKENKLEKVKTLRKKA